MTLLKRITLTNERSRELEITEFGAQSVSNQSCARENFNFQQWSSSFRLRSFGSRIQNKIPFLRSFLFFLIITFWYDGDRIFAEVEDIMSRLIERKNRRAFPEQTGTLRTQQATVLKIGKTVIDRDYSVR